MCLIYNLDNDEQFEKTLAADHRACRYNCERNGRCFFAIFNYQNCYLYVWDYSVDDYGNWRPDQSLLLPISKPNEGLRVIFVRTTRYSYGQIVPRMPEFTAEELVVEEVGLCSTPGTFSN